MYKEITFITVAIIFILIEITLFLYFKRLYAKAKKQEKFFDVKGFGENGYYPKNIIILEELPRIEDNPEFIEIMQKLNDFLEKNKKPSLHEIYPDEPQTTMQ